MDTLSCQDNHFLSQISDVFTEYPLKDTPYFIGMMSGTSLDGMDAVICEFFEKEPLAIIERHSLPFPKDLRDALLALTTPDGIKPYIQNNQLSFESELDVFGWASVYYAHFASQVVLELLEKSQIDASQVSAIGCHGQTVRHRPQWSFSLQLLDPNVLAQNTAIAVVSDFRRRDMAVGGQGAPLVPAFHQATFGDYSQVRGVLNLGGIANITILADQDNPAVLGFDTGVANLLMDAWTSQHLGLPYDKNGDWAKSGRIIRPLLELLLNHDFFGKEPPKSTGREEFHLDWLEQQLTQLEKQHPNLSYSPADVQATLAELTAISASDQIKKFIQSGDLVVCGGGALNNHLISRLQNHLPNIAIKSSQEFGIDPTLVEAAAFAWLARQNILMQPGNVPEVTGAQQRVVLGQICF